LKQAFIIKSGLLCLTVILILLIWFGFRTIDQQAIKIDSLTKEVDRKEDQIEFLKTNNRMKTTEVNETETAKMEESINVFVQSMFHVKDDQLEQRCEKAKAVLTQELYNKYFPTEDKKQKLLYEHEVNDSRIYVKNKGENGNAIVILEETMTSLANNQKESSRITIEVFLQKEGEKWLVNRFEQLNAESL
jgi:cell division protein FtsI/penicillin-binding protein 2